MTWIDLPAVGKIVGYGLLAGAGLPVLFAAGMLALSRGPRARAATAGAGNDTLVGGSPVGMAGAALCFLVVLAATGWGVYEIYQLGHPSH
ncbi:MAG: hypothetical protein FWE35_01490 [Streptosporangiales bacterium]|jgi:hypothetical protein|nr:hypothetical protein [Streptosporangiales bacterium]